MEKRLPLALFLAFLVLFGWQLIFPPPRPPEVPPAPSGPALEPGALEQGQIPEAELAVAGEPALADSEERTLELKTSSYRARFGNRGGALLELDAAEYVREVGQDVDDPDNWLPLVESCETAAGPTGSLLVRRSAVSARDLAPVDLDQVLWRMEALSAPEQGVLFRYSPPGGKVVFEKRIVLGPDPWHLHFSFSIENVAAGAGHAADFALVPAGCMPPELGDRFYPEPKVVAVGGTPGRYKLKQVAAPRLKKSGSLDVPLPVVAGGQHNKYFAFLLREAGEQQVTLGGARYRPVQELGPNPRELIELELPVTLALPGQGQKKTWEYLVYAGPKRPDVFAPDFPAHQLVLDEDLGSFLFFSLATIARPLLAVLRLFHSLVGNWGVAIILLTLCVRGGLFPLNRRSQTAMSRYQKKMKRVQPRLEEAKKRHEGDPQKLREAQARIMQEEGAFPPLGGCLPMLLQMPIFFGLFSALRTSFDLRQAPFFGWINDLSRPDRLLPLHLELPILPDIEYLNLLPILMVVLWVLQQKGMPKPADEQAAKMQKMMMFMPVLFGVMLYNYAAGLSLYMMTTSGMSILEQKVIRKLWPIDDSEPVKSDKKGCSPFSGAMKQLAERHQDQMKRMQAMQAEQRRRQNRKGKR